MLPSWDNLISICLSWIRNRLLLLCLWLSALTLWDWTIMKRSALGMLRTDQDGRAVSGRRRRPPCIFFMCLLWPTSSKRLWPVPDTVLHLWLRVRTCSAFMCLHVHACAHKCVNTYVLIPWPTDCVRETPFNVSVVYRQHRGYDAFVIRVCVGIFSRPQARQQAQMRQQMATDSKNDYSSYLQKFNQEQNEHYFTIIPNIFQVNKPSVDFCLLVSAADCND